MSLSFSSMTLHEEGLWERGSCEREQEESLTHRNTLSGNGRQLSPDSEETHQEEEKVAAGIHDEAAMGAHCLVRWSL